MKIRALFILLVLIILCSSPNVIAGKDIYKHVDKDGRITFTNRPIHNAHKVTVASFSRNSEPKKLGVQTNFSRVKDTTQKERDVMRRRILEKELVSEEKLFADIENYLAQISNHRKLSNYQEKVIQLENKLILHQRNITALKKELANL